MRFIAGPLNKQLLQNQLAEVIESCTRVRAAVAYAKRDNMKLFEACAKHLKPLEFYGRYDHTVAVDPAVLKWFLDKASQNYDCKLVPDILHAKVRGNMHGANSTYRQKSTALGRLCGHRVVPCWARTQESTLCPRKSSTAPCTE